MIQPKVGIHSVTLGNEHLAPLLLVDVVDQRWFDLQFEFMLFIVRVCLVMLQTGPERNQKPGVVIYFCKLHHTDQFTFGGPNDFTVWKGRGSHKASTGKCCTSEWFLADGAAFGVEWLVPADPPRCSNNRTAVKKRSHISLLMVMINIKVVKVIDSGIPNGLKWSILHLRGKKGHKI